MSYQIKEVADMAGVSVRTLHHSDRIGLFSPAEINEAGYRLYSRDDLVRLQEILFFRELGFSLSDINEIVHKPFYDRWQALVTQRELLNEQKKRLGRIVKMVDRAIDKLEESKPMDEKELFDGLDNETLEEYKREARERWGDSAAFKESERKTSKYTKADWERIGAESSDIYIKIAELMEAGKEPSDSEVQAQTKRWFDHLCENFYTCTPEIFRGLADGYVQDRRFTTNIDKIRPGLAAFLSKAMKIYADFLELQTPTRK